MRLEGIALSFCRLDSDADITLAEAADLLAADEETRARRFRFDRDRHRFVRARGFLRQVLGQAMDKAPETIVFSYSKTGKPGVDGGPAFNLSHSADRGVVALGGTTPLGVDIEKADRRMRDLEALAQRCFTPGECAAIDAAPDPLARFLAFWCAKEARMKMTGEGMGLDPRDIHLALDQGGLPRGYDAPIAPAAKLASFQTEGLTGALAIALGG